MQKLQHMHSFLCRVFQMSGQCWVSDIGHRGQIVSASLGIAGSLALMWHLTLPAKRKDLRSLGLTSLIFLNAVCDFGACLMALITGSQMVASPDVFRQPGAVCCGFVLVLSFLCRLDKFSTFSCRMW